MGKKMFFFRMEIIDNSIDGLRAAETLQHSFRDDPVVLYVLEFIKDEHLKKEFYKKLFQITLCAAIEYDNVISTGKDNHYGVAIWYPPDKHSPSSLIEVFTKKFYELPYILGLTASFKALNTIVLPFDKNRNKHMKGKKYYYLQMLGVSPDQQGKGYSSKIMKPIIGKADKENLYCYLECTKQENVAIYEHFGFNVVEEYKINDNLPVWLMIRKPKN
ncbi:unnamed protein product [Cunninghamella echinulata]